MISASVQRWDDQAGRWITVREVRGADSMRGAIAAVIADLSPDSQDATFRAVQRRFGEEQSQILVYEPSS